MGRGLLNSSREHTQSMFGLWVWKKHQELLTPYLQAASVVSLSWFFTCGVEIFSSSARASSADIPAFSAACGEVGGGQGCQCGGGCKLQRTLGFPSSTPMCARNRFVYLRVRVCSFVPDLKMEWKEQREGTLSLHTLLGHLGDQLSLMSSLHDTGGYSGRGHIPCSEVQQSLSCAEPMVESRLLEFMSGAFGFLFSEFWISPALIPGNILGLLTVRSCC